MLQYNSSTPPDPSIPDILIDSHDRISSSELADLLQPPEPYQFSLIDTKETSSTLLAIRQAEKYLDLKLDAHTVVHAQSARKHPAHLENGEIDYASPGNPKPKFTGKNPSYFDDAGQPQLCSIHKPFSKDELFNLLKDSRYGIGYSVPSHIKNIATIDIDSKNYVSQSECNRCFEKLKNQYYGFFALHVERTRSGGYHILVMLHPDDVATKFTHFICEGFELAEGATRHGELIRSFVVCAPTEGYTIIQDGTAAPIPPLAELGIISTSENGKASEKYQEPKNIAEGAIAVRASLKPTKISESYKDFVKKSGRPILISPLLCKTVKDLIPAPYISKKNGKGEDRSDRLTTILNETQGWVNFLISEGIPFEDDTDLILKKLCERLDNFSEKRFEQNRAEIQTDFTLVPRILYIEGGLELAWKKVSNSLKTNEELAIEWHRDKRASAKEYTPSEGCTFDKYRVSVDILIWAVSQGYDVIGIKSSMGTGKTEIIIKFLETWDKGVILLGSRNALLLQTCKRIIDAELKFNIYHLYQDDASDRTSDMDSWIAHCVDSLHKYEHPSQFDGKLLILDEATSFMVHLLLSPTVGKGKYVKFENALKKKGRAFYLEMFKELVKRAAHIILLDGNLNNDVVTWIENIRNGNGKECKTIKYLNEFKPASMNCNFIATFDGDSNKPYDDSPVTEHLYSLASTLHIYGGQKALAVIADDKGHLNRLAKVLTEKYGLRCFVADADSMKEDWAKKTIENINDSVKNREYDIYLFSPTVAEGLDVSEKLEVGETSVFLQGFAYFRGLISTDTQMQFLRRIRELKTWNIHCVEATRLHNNEKIDDQIEAWIYEVTNTLNQDNQAGILNACLKEIDLAVDSEDYYYAKKILNNRIHERYNSAKCLKGDLLEAGHNVLEIELQCSESITDELMLMRDEDRAAESKKIFESQEITDEEAKELSNNIGRSKEQQHELDRFKFKENFCGGNADSEIFNESSIYEVRFGKGWEMKKKVERFLTLQYMDSQRKNTGSTAVNKITASAIINKTSVIAKATLVQSLLGLRGCRISAGFCPWLNPIGQAETIALDELRVLDLLDGQAHNKGTRVMARILARLKEDNYIAKILGFNQADSNPVSQLHIMLKNKLGFEHESHKFQKAGKRETYHVYSSFVDAVEDDKTAFTLKNIYINTKEAMAKKLESTSGTSDREFDSNALIINGVPHHYEWASPTNCEKIDNAYNAALQATGDERTKKLSEVITKVKQLWRTLKPVQVIVASEKSVRVTEVVTVEHVSYEQFSSEWKSETGHDCDRATYEFCKDDDEEK